MKHALLPETSVRLLAIRPPVQDSAVEMVLLLLDQQPYDGACHRVSSSSPKTSVPSRERTSAAVASSSDWAASRVSAVSVDAHADDQLLGGGADGRVAPALHQVADLVADVRLARPEGQDRPGQQNALAGRRLADAAARRART